MRKRLLAQVLALCMVLSLLPVSVLAEDGQFEQDEWNEQDEQDWLEPAAAGEPFVSVGIQEVSDGRLPAGDTITVIATSADMGIIVTGMTIAVQGGEDGTGTPLTPRGTPQKLEDAVCNTYSLVFETTEVLRRAWIGYQFDVGVSYKVGEEGELQTANMSLPHSGSYMITAGAPAKIEPTTPYDLMLRPDGTLALETGKDPGVYLTDTYGNSVSPQDIPSSGIEGEVTVQPDTPASGWGITKNSVVTNSFGRSVTATFSNLQVYTDNGEALRGAKIKFTSTKYGEAKYISTELWPDGGTFNIPGAKLTPPADPVKAGSAVTLNVTEAKDADFASIAGSKSVSVADVTGGVKRQLIANAAVAFTDGEAAIALPESVFTEATLGERTLDVTIGGIYQTIQTKVTVETAKSKLSIDGLVKPGEEGTDPVTGDDITKTYDGTKTVPAALYRDWSVKFKDEDKEAITLEKGKDYLILSPEFDSKDAGTQTVTAVVQLLNSAGTKDYSLSGEGKITISGASIIPREITISKAAAENKAYDGTAAAKVTPTFAGLVAGESLSADDCTVTASFDSKDAGRAKPVTYSVALKTEGTAKNYTLKDADAEGNSLLPAVTADITAVTLTPSVSFEINNEDADAGTPSTKIAVGTKLTANAAVAGAVGSETPVLAYAWTVNGQAAAADAGTLDTYTVKDGDKNITVTVSLAAADGAAVNGNYVMASAAKTAAVGSVMINADSLTLPEGGKITKVYDGTTRAALPNGASVVFKAGSEALPENVSIKYTVRSVAYTSADAGTHAVTVTVELSAGNGNYVLNNGTFTFTNAANVDITKADVPAPTKSLRVAVDAEQAITITTDGAVSGRIDDETKATVSVKDNVVTVKGVATGSAKLTISAAAGRNYNALTETEVAVTVTAKSTGSGGGGSSGGSSSGGNSSGNNFNNNGTTTDSTIYSGYTGGTVTVRSTAYVDNGSAVVSVGSSDAQSMVREAAQNNSGNVTVIAEIPSGQSADTVRAELPASAVSDLYNRTNASLTVETPVASVVIPNASLYQLGSGSGDVAVVTTRNSANTVSVAVQRNGYSVASLSSGMKVEIPVTSVAANSGVVAVLVNPNGSETVLPKSAVNGYDLSVLLDSGSATIRYRNNAKPFSDVSGTYWASDAIDFVSSHNLFIGTTNTTFSGYTTMNRAMLVTVLHRLESTPSAGSYSFADVPYNSYYAQAASWASSRGIVQGDGTGFSGSRAVTREEMAVMLYRYVKTINGNQGEMGSYYNMPGAGQVSGWASEAMRWAVGSGIIQGDNTGNLRPQSSATRAEVAQMLMNFVELITR